MDRTMSGDSHVKPDRKQLDWVIRSWFSRTLEHRDPNDTDADFDNMEDDELLATMDAARDLARYKKESCVKADIAKLYGPEQRYAHEQLKREWMDVRLRRAQLEKPSCVCQ